MNTLEHFRTLYQIVKKDGVISALEYDANVTMQRHPRPVSQAQRFGLVAMLMGATAMAGAHALPEVTSDYPFLAYRMNSEIKRAKRFSNYIPRTMQELVAQAHEDRETGRAVVANLGNGLAATGLGANMLVLLAGLAGAYRRKQEGE